jgi:hypothetical protein
VKTNTVCLSSRRKAEQADAASVLEMETKAA